MGDEVQTRRDIAAFHDLGPPSADFGALFLAGMSRTPKSLVGSMLLDRRSAAFRRVCGLAEYYVERAELRILRDQAAAIAHAVGPAAQVVDFSRCLSPQTLELLDILHRPWGFVGIDRDPEPLLTDARRVQELHPELWVEAVRADLRYAFDLPANVGGGRRVGYLPGNVIGAFDPPEALSLLSLWGQELRPGGLFLVGVDQRKSVLILEAAYDDPHGVNKALLLEVLLRANRELGADFDVRLFDHRVQADPLSGRVGGYLVSVGPHDVHIGDKVLHFAQGEAIHIGASWKYSVTDFQAMARGAGFRPLDVWIDPKDRFGIHLLEAGI